MEEQDFRRHADQALDELYRKLARAADQYDFETDFNAGALAIEFEDPPAKFVISPNAPVRQIWVSAHSRSYKLDWNPERSAFVFPENGFSLTELIAGAISRQLGTEVPL
jgi:frataxin